jgi:hypothetical protein
MRFRSSEKFFRPAHHNSNFKKQRTGILFLYKRTASRDTPTIARCNFTVRFDRLVFTVASLPFLFRRRQACVHMSLDDFMPWPGKIGYSEKAHFSVFTTIFAAQARF